MSDTSSPESVGKREPPPRRRLVGLLRFASLCLALLCFADVSPSKGGLEEIVRFKADRKMLIVTDAGLSVNAVSMKSRLFQKK